MENQPEISIALTSGFLISTLGTDAVRTSFSMEALSCSILAFSGSLNLLMNFPLKCHSFLPSPHSSLLWSGASHHSSISTFISSSFHPERHRGFGVSFESIWVFTNAEFSSENPGKSTKWRGEWEIFEWVEDKGWL